jgi:aconitate hydratase
MSPPLVVAFALAGRIDTDLRKDAIGKGKDGKPVYLADIWPTQREVEEAVERSVTAEMFSKSYAEVFSGDERWRSLSVPKGQTYAWEKDSTYIRRAPYFDDMKIQPSPVDDIHSARVLAVLGDSVTTDHISPAGSIKKDGPAGKYLQEHGVKPADFNSYGSRRGNHEVMVRGTFANVRLRNKLVNTEGGFTRHLPTNQEMSIFDASQKYQAEGTPLIILAGKEYGSGSSRKGHGCSGFTPSSPRVTNAFTARTLSAWEFCRCNSRLDKTPSRSISPAKKFSRLRVSAI